MDNAFLASERNERFNDVALSCCKVQRLHIARRNWARHNDARNGSIKIFDQLQNGSGQPFWITVRTIG